MIVKNNFVSERDNAASGLTPDDLAARMRLSTVKLHHGQFTGSGVIFTTSENAAYVLTAKHNLLIWAKGQGRNNVTMRAGAWDGTRADLRGLNTDFKTNIRLVYGNGREAQIHEIVYFGSNWSYDVCCLVIRDGGFRSFARTHAWDFEPFGVGFDFSYRTTLTALFDNLRRRTNNDLQTTWKTQINQGYYFFQAGYGATGYSGGTTIAKVNSDSGGSFGYRLADLSDSWATAYDRDATQNTTDDYTDVIALTADSESSSGPGDSGGPVFAIRRNQANVRVARLSLYLVGVTVGYNYHRLTTSPIQTSTTFKNNIIADLRAAYNVTDPVIWGTAGGPQAYTALWDNGGV